MVCGWDKQGPHIFYVDNDASCIEGNLFSVGSTILHKHTKLNTNYMSILKNIFVHVTFCVVIYYFVFVRWFVICLRCSRCWVQVWFVSPRCRWARQARHFPSHVISSLYTLTFFQYAYEQFVFLWTYLIVFIFFTGIVMAHQEVWCVSTTSKRVAGKSSTTVSNKNNMKAFFIKTLQHYFPHFSPQLCSFCSFCFL